MVTHPHDTAVCANASAAFNIVAVNTTSYQWQENDGVGWYDLDATVSYVEGEHTPILSILNANMGLNTYQYRCVISDATAATDTSEPASLLVFEPPVITANPQNQHVCKNEIASYSITALNGTEYQWQENSGIGWLNLEDNSFYSGTSTSNLDIYTTTGMNNFLYRCIVIHVSCPDTTESAQLNVDPTPVVYSITGGGTICEGDNGLDIGLDGSEIGVSYDLVKDGVHTGIVVAGTGNPISFGVFNETGTYTTHAYDNYTACSVDMAGVANIFANPLPLDFTVQGGGTICIGDEGSDIFLSGSELGISYQLYLNGNPIGQQIQGTSYPISFGLFSTAGFYTVIASHALTGCQRQLSGNAQVIVNTPAIVDAGSDQIINQGDVALLSGSAIGGSGNYTFSWTPSNLCNNPENASTQTIALYQSSLFILEVMDIDYGCISLADTTVIYVGDGPLHAQALSDQNDICVGEAASLMAMASGGSGSYSYSYSWTSIPEGFTSTIQNSIVSPGENTLYVLSVSDGSQMAFDTVSIMAFSKPIAFQLQGGGSYCAGGNGVDIFLNGSESGVNYQLYHLGSVIDELPGTGQSLYFSPQLNEGSYYAVASSGSGCHTDQSGSASVSISPLPIADAGINSYINAGQNASLNGNATGGTGNHTYIWSPADSLLNPSSPSPSTVPLYTTTVFHLFVEDEASCISTTDNTVVFVSGGEISLEVISSTDFICPGETVQLFALASGGSGSFTYLWQSTPGSFTSTQFNPTVQPTEDTWYTVIVNDGLRVLTDSILIHVNPEPSLFNFSGGGSVCAGENPDDLILDNSESGVDYNLFRNGVFTDQTLSGDGYALNFGNWIQPGEYSVTAINSYSLCESNMTGSPSIQIYNIPLVDAGLDQSINTGTTANLLATASGASGTYAFSWQPEHMVQSPGSQSTTTQPLVQSTVFSVIVTDLQTQCASLADSVSIFTAGGSLGAQASANKYQVCTSEQVQLFAMGSGGTANYSYSWTSQPQGFNSSSSNPMVFPQTPTTYYLEVFDGINYAHDSLFVQVFAYPGVYQLTGGGAYCEGASGNYIGLNGSESDVHYSLYMESGQLMAEKAGDGLPINFGNFQQQGNYFATAVSNTICSVGMNGQVSVIRHMLPIAEAGDNQSISFGGQTTLYGSATAGSGNYNYSWYPGDSLLNPHNQTPATQALHQTTLFELEVSDLTTGCSGGQSDQTVVFVSGGPLTLELSATQSQICPGEETQLFGLVSGGSGSYTYLWQSNPSGFASTLFNPVVQAFVQTTYTLTVSDGSNSVSESITISIHALPQPFSLTGGGDVCEGFEPGNIFLDGSEVQTSYVLLKDYVSTGLNLQGDGYALDFGNWTDNGSYTVEAINSYSGCSNTMSGVATVNIQPTPLAYAGPDQSILSGNSTFLSGSGSGGSGVYSYAWTPAHMCSAPQSQNTNTYAISQTTAFTLHIVDIQSQCESESDTVIIFSTGGFLEVEASASQYMLCENEDIQLVALGSGGSGNYSYTWSSSPAGFYSSLYNPVTTVSVSTVFYVEVFDGNSYATDSVFIQAIPNPLAFHMTGGGAYCDGGYGHFIGLDGSESGSTYKLYKEPGILLQTISGNGQPLSFGNYTDPGVYYATANNNNLCYKDMHGNSLIEIYQLPLVNAGNDKSIQFGEQAVLNGSALGGSGNYIYNWIPTDSLVNPSNADALTIPLGATTLFELQLSDASTSCVGTPDQAIVFVAGGPLQAQLLVSHDNICPEESSQLFALASGGSGSYTYLWSSNPPGFSATTYNPEVNPLVSTVYTVMINDGSSIISDSISIQVFDAPQGFDLIGGGNYCEGDNGLELFLVDSEENVSYELFNLEGSTDVVMQGSGNDVSFGYHQEASTYWVVAHNTNGCSAEMNNSTSIVIDALPLADAGPDLFIETGNTTTLMGSASGGSGDYLYYWSPDYLLNDPNIPQPTTLILYESTVFSLYVTDIQSSCVSESNQTTVYVTDGDLSLSVAAQPTSVCTHDEVQLSALPTGGSGNYSYSWSSDPEGFNSNLQNPLTYPEVSSWFIASVSDADTIVYDSVYVEVAVSPSIFSVIGGGEMCTGESGLQIQLSGSEYDIVYQLWRNQTQLVTELVGDGNPINFGSYTQAGTYTVSASRVGSSCEVAMAGSAIILVFEAPVADAGNDIVIPSGTYTTINGSASGGSGVFQFQWTPAAYLLNPTAANPTTKALTQSTLFSLEVSDVNTSCISQTSDMIVFVSGGSDLSAEILAQSTHSCPSQEISLVALPTGGSGDYSYYWQSKPEGYFATTAAISIFPDTETWYVVTISDGVHVIKDSVKIEMYSSPDKQILAGGGGYCTDGSGMDIYLQGSNLNDNYTLFHNTTSTGISKTGTGSQLDFGTFTLTGNYYVEALNSYGCRSQMDGVVEVYINPKPEKFELLGGGVYCDNDPSLGVILSGSEINVSYELYKDAAPTGLVESGNGLPLSFSGLSGHGIYTAVATHTESFCTNIMSGAVEMLIHDSPVIEIEGDTDLCLGESTTLTATGGDSYLWDTDPPSPENQITLTPEVSTLYSVTATLTNGCSSVKEVEVFITESPSLYIENNEENYSLLCYPDDLSTYTFGMGNTIFQSGESSVWFYGDQVLQADSVWVEAENEAGCSATSSVMVSSDEPPNAFTPNGDGRNDLFMEGKEIRVFSRWGKEIYHGTEGWTGKHQGQLVAPGTYYYVHEIMNTEGQIIKTLKGSVTLVIKD